MTEEYCVSIIIPSFQRREKVFRFLTFIEQEVVTRNICNCINDFEIRILEYYDSKNELLDEKINELIQHINKVNKIIFHEKSNVKCLYQRLSLLVNNSKFNSILICGDDDLPCITNALSLNKIRFLKGHKCICGSLLNIRGFKKDSLFIDSRERLITNFRISFEDPLQRVINYFALNSIGCSSISYSICDKNLLKYIFDILNTNSEKLFYGGSEFIIQMLTLLKSKVVFSCLPLILRDFTYINYEYEEKREAKADDKFPYYGEFAINVCKDEINKLYPNLDMKTICKLLKNLILQSQQVADSFHMYRDCINPNKVFKKQNYNNSKQTLINAYQAWKDTELLCFGDSFRKLYSSNTINIAND